MHLPTIFIRDGSSLDQLHPLALFEHDYPRGDANEKSERDEEADAPARTRTAGPAPHEAAKGALKEGVRDVEPNDHIEFPDLRGSGPIAG